MSALNNLARVGNGIAVPRALVLPLQHKLPQDKFFQQDYCDSWSRGVCWIEGGSTHSSVFSKKN